MSGDGFSSMDAQMDAIKLIMPGTHAGLVAAISLIVGLLILAI